MQWVFPATRTYVDRRTRASRSLWGAAQIEGWVAHTGRAALLLVGTWLNATKRGGRSAFSESPAYAW